MKIKYVLETPEDDDTYDDVDAVRDLTDRFEQFLQAREEKVFVLPPGVLLREIEVPCCGESHD